MGTLVDAAVMMSCVGDVGTAVATNVVAMTDAAPFTLAVSVFCPAVEPSVQLPTVAIPEPSVVAVAPVIVPPPVPTANVTATPDTTFPTESLTSTDGETVTMPSVSALALSPANLFNVPGNPAVTMISAVCWKPPTFAVTTDDPIRTACNSPVALTVTIALSLDAKVMPTAPQWACCRH